MVAGRLIFVLVAIWLLQEVRVVLKIKKENYLNIEILSEFKFYED